jgi:hypothetical protein
MTKTAVVALAEALRIHNRTADGRTEFTPDLLLVLADFCASQDPNFNRLRWIDYIAGEGGSDDEMMFGEPDNMRVSGAIVGDKPSLGSRAMGVDQGVARRDPQLTRY